MYGDVVLGLKPESKDEEDPFEVALQEKKRARGVTLDTELDADALREVVDEFKALIRMRKGVRFPEDPHAQLWGAIGAVFGSWMNQRAIVYRKLNNIPESWGTAVNVQAMVFGNMGADSGTGVAFTRDPATGENVFYGEFLMNAQGEDVVAGTRTPLPIAALEKENRSAYAELVRIRRTLERHYRDMMDIEFTIQQRKLYMLQCRVGKRTAFAAIRIAVDMVRERLISRDEALRRGAAHRLQGARDAHHGPRRVGARGRLRLARRLDRRGVPGPDRDHAERGGARADRARPRAGPGAGLSPLCAAHEVGRPGAAPRGARQRGPARPGRQRARLRGPGRGPLPHRAHVLRRGEDRPHARDDPRRHGGGAARGARQAPPPPARRLRGPLPRHERPPGDDSHAGSAVARVPAARRGRAARGGGRARHSLRSRCAARSA